MKRACCEDKGCSIWETEDITESVRCSTKAREYAHHSVRSAYTSGFLKTALLLRAETHVSQNLLCGQSSALELLLIPESSTMGHRAEEFAAEDHEAEVGVARDVLRRPGCL